MSDALTVIDQDLENEAAIAQRQAITAKFFHGLSDPTRMRIVEVLLDEGEQNVTELVTLLGQPQSQVSNHLACLRWCGYVESRREGKFIYYSVADPRLREILELARAVIAGHAAAILSCTRM